MNKNKQLLILTGGTGGHVIPAINYANYLISRGYQCSLLLDKRGSKYVNKFNGKINIISSSHFSGNIFHKIKSLINLFIGFIQSFFLILKLKPKKCISFGSYATFSPLFVILILKIFIKTHIYIHEQNSIIGKVNLLFLPYSKYIFTNFNSVKRIDRKFSFKKIYTGLPFNDKIISDLPQNNKINDKYIIFIYGGSQGATSIINLSLLMLKNLDNIFLKKIKLIIQSPKKLITKLNFTIKKLKIDFEICEFYENIEEVLSIANLAITRAGAGTINDLIRYRVPSMIFPLSSSIYNHQFYNAKYLSDVNAAILVDENNFNLDISTLNLTELLTDVKKFKIMKQALEDIILPDANNIMTRKIFYENAQ